MSHQQSVAASEIAGDSRASSSQHPFRYLLIVGFVIPPVMAASVSLSPPTDTASRMASSKLLLSRSYNGLRHCLLTGSYVELIGIAYIIAAKLQVVTESSDPMAVRICLCYSPALPSTGQLL